MNDMERRIDRYYETLYDKYNEYNDYTPVDTNEVEKLEDEIAHLKGIIEDIVWLAENETIERIREFIESEGLNK